MDMKLRHGEPKVELLKALMLASLVSFVLYGLAVQRMGWPLFTYLPNNLVLAWAPLLVAILLSKLLRTRLWSDWVPLAVTAVWVVFLPNSFYMITDLIHLDGLYSGDLVSASVVFFAFAMTGLLLGFASVLIVHQRLIERMEYKKTWLLIGLTFLLCSLAIYIGRDLRWNSWDVLLSPSGLLFDISERFMHPSEYGNIFAVAGSFFVLLMGMYVVMLKTLRALAKAPRL